MRAPGMRVALYWAPAFSDPLWAAGNSWLGRDPEHGVAVPQPALAGIGEVTQAPRLYGFHATLRPPMRLATSWDDFLQTADGLAGSLSAFDLPPLLVDELDGFLALRESRPCPGSQSLADSCVREIDRHRLPPSDVELAKRRAAVLSVEEEQLLRRWGYPYVMQRWRFHMTLTRRLSPEEVKVFRPAAEAHFATSIAAPRRVTHITVFTQLPPASFLIVQRLKLRG